MLGRRYSSPVLNRVVKSVQEFAAIGCWCSASLEAWFIA